MHIGINGHLLAWTGDYRAAGVSSNLLDDMHGQAGKELAAAQEARKANDGLAMVKSASNGRSATYGVPPDDRTTLPSGLPMRSS